MKNLKPLILIVSLFSISFLSTIDARNSQEDVNSQYYDDYDDEYDDSMMGAESVNKNEKTIHLNTNQPPKESTTEVAVKDLVGLGRIVHELRVLLQNIYPILRPVLILAAVGASIFAAQGAYMTIFTYLNTVFADPTAVNVSISGGGCLQAVVTIVVAVALPVCTGLVARYLTLTAKVDDKDVYSKSEVLR